MNKSAKLQKYAFVLHVSILNPLSYIDEVIVINIFEKNFGNVTAHLKMSTFAKILKIELLSYS